MTSRFTVIVVAAAALCVGLILGRNVSEETAVAQPRIGLGNGTFQISAYASTVGDNVHHGCYVLDTSTGRVFHVLLGGNSEKVAERLP